MSDTPEIARLNRDVVITEKIDGTNATIGITESGVTDPLPNLPAPQRRWNPTHPDLVGLEWVAPRRPSGVLTAGQAKRLKESEAEEAIRRERAR